MDDKSKAARQAAIALATMAVLTGGEFLGMMDKEFKRGVRPREICQKCRNNRSGFEHICRGGTKTLAEGTEIVIISCSNFECEPESGTEEIREGAPESFSEKEVETNGKRQE